MLSARRRQAQANRRETPNPQDVTDFGEKKSMPDVVRAKTWMRNAFVFILVIVSFVVLNPPGYSVSTTVTKLDDEKDVVETGQSYESANYEDRSLEQASKIQSTAAVTGRGDERCSISHHEVNSPDAPGSGSDTPVLIRGWEKPKKWGEQDLMENMGHFPQYLKDGFVQPIKDNQGELCTLPGAVITKLMKKVTDRDLLFFTNDQENSAFMKDLSEEYDAPDFLNHIKGFDVFSAMTTGKSHSFHKHGESWLGQVEGRRMWWFLPPTAEKPGRVNACEYMKGTAPLPEGALSCIQEPGDIIWFPKDWYHATCALDEWTVGVGSQQGPLIRQQFSPLQQNKMMSKEEVNAKASECLGIAASDDPDWTWFGGDLNAYYNSLEKDHPNRNPENIASYAVHRWMGEKRSTEVHYQLLNGAVSRYHNRASAAIHVFDGGCGLGSGLMWMEKTNPNWKLTGHTISEEQYKFITEKLPKHNFNVNLKSYNELENDYDFMYSIEALIHSPNVTETMEEWAKHLNEGGVIAIIDDFASVGTKKDDVEVIEFARSWLANSLFTPTELGNIGRKFGLRVVENRDLDAEYQINELNYKNTMPNLNPDKGKTHQGWMGSKWRQRLTLEGKLTYNMLVFQKGGSSSTAACAKRPTKDASSAGATFAEITPELMTGKGAKGGDKMACISSWYCCNKGQEWFDNLEANRTESTSYLKLPKTLFGHYIEAFAKHLNEYYKTYPENSKGRFLDIGGTGSTASGMTQVTSKFQHFAGPLDYWILDSDIGAKELERTLYCDIDDCPAAETCGFDVTFSHTVLEHAKRPWESFDTIARITKKGGLTMHLVPWSYQFHATPDDNYRFSHNALKLLLEDRGFTVLDVGYDICTKPPKMLRKIDEHYDVIWLTYVIGRKN